MTIPVNTSPNLFPAFAQVISELSQRQLEDPGSADDLHLASTAAGNKTVKMVYAPFDHVNASARVVIVGLTPGKQQAVSALKAAHSSLRSGASHPIAAQQAKVFASFSGPMRTNLVRMLDHIGVHKLLGISTTATLWDQDERLIHFTSALRYPVFVDGENWSGAPDMLRTGPMREWLETYTGPELAALSDAILVPLGPKVTAALEHLARTGLISGDRILDGLPHPSGANAERIAYFLGSKPSALLSPKTHAAALDASRVALMQRVARL